MNVESLKSELQQVLDNDVTLRKEFNSLKRSLSDYRNQLIMRDEDCKRLQVTIDVLNTKLVVIERDNTSYKAELNSFKELRGTIREQLEEKQTEIDTRIAEIQDLRNQLAEISASYESKIEDLKTANSNELERVKADYNEQIHSLKSNSHYVENGIRDEYENRLSELSSALAEKEQQLAFQKDAALQALRLQHSAEVGQLQENFKTQLSEVSADGDDRVETLKQVHEQILNELEQSHVNKFESMSTAYQLEIQNLKSALEEQRSTLTTNFNLQIEQARTTSSDGEQNLRAEFEAKILAVENQKATEMAATVESYELRMQQLIAEYDEKLSNTVIHSTAQNSKLNEELQNSRDEQESFTSQLTTLNELLASTQSKVNLLEEELQQKDQLAGSSAETLQQLSSEFEAYKVSAQQSDSEKTIELTSQIEALTLSHNEVVSQLNSEIAHLTSELDNIATQFQNASNLLGEAESTIEKRNTELLEATALIAVLTSQVESFDETIAGKENEFEVLRAELESKTGQEIEHKQTEFEKLLVENTQLISEIDSAQDRVEAQDYEISLLKAELEEIRVSSAGKSDYFKETLSNKNFEITNLEANNAAMQMEVQMLKDEVTNLSAQVGASGEASVELERYRAELESKQSELAVLRSENLVLNERITLLAKENEQLKSELQFMQDSVHSLQEEIVSLNTRIAENEAQLQSASVKDTAEQDAFIDRLFKQIDELNDQRMVLLDEKEQMALQLLKMNEVVGAISQQVDSQKIDVAGLNNYRKNVILGSNSGTTDNQQFMKEQINDLVREIDKCIALLSA